MIDRPGALAWALKVCAEKNIHVSGGIADIKDENLFRVPTDTGSLYVKRTGTLLVDELDFTLGLLRAGIIRKPECVAYDRERKLCLTRYESVAEYARRLIA